MQFIHSAGRNFRCLTFMPTLKRWRVYIRTTAMSVTKSASNSKSSEISASSPSSALPPTASFESPPLPHERQSPDTHRFLRHRDHCPLSQIFFANPQHVLK